MHVSLTLLMHIYVFSFMYFIAIYIFDLQIGEKDLIFAMIASPTFAYMLCAFHAYLIIYVYA